MKTDEAFGERVKKTFGNLFASVSHTPTPSSLSNPLWSLTGDAVEKREWRRDPDTSDRDNNPCASSFDDFVSCARRNSRKNLKNYKKEFDDDMPDFGGDDGGDDEAAAEAEEEEEGGGGLDDWDLRGSIGLDSTLDNEAEEDAYDKVATGRENASDRYYMSDIAEKSIPNRNDLSSDMRNRQRDPRANRLAASIRLKEDDAEVAAEAGHHNTAQVPFASAEKESVSSARDDDNVKPILKRKGHESTLNPSKRVRFDPEYASEGNANLGKENAAGENPLEILTSVDQSVLNENVSRLPDYVQTSSNYTCYNLDSTDEINDKSNTGANLDALYMEKKIQNTGIESEQEDTLDALPKPITFVPKKRSDSATGESVNAECVNARDDDSKYSSALPHLVADSADEELQQTEIRDMEVEEPQKSAEPGTTIGKQGRQYRTKLQTDEPE